MHHPFALALATILLLCSFTVAVGVDFGVKLDPRPNDSDPYRWSSILTYPDANLGEIDTDDKLAGIAKKACAEMRDQIADSKIGAKNQPAVMTAMHVGNQVYLASSAKGKNFVYLPKITPEHKYTDKICGEVTKILESCSMKYKRQWSDDSDASEKHRNRAQCGEVMALQQYCALNGKLPIGSETKVRLVAWDCPKKGDGQVKAPCGSDEERRWGCKQLLEELKYTGITTANAVDPTFSPQSPGQGCVV